jgi:hypothetical protein
MSAIFTCEACGQQVVSTSVTPPKGWTSIWVGDQTGDGPDGVACSQDCAQYKRNELAGRITAASCTAKYTSDSENGGNVVCGSPALRAGRCPRHLREELQELAKEIAEFERRIHASRLRQQQLEGT